MTAAIKTRLDAIDAQMAELQKEQAKLRGELDKPDFVPGFYVTWSLDHPFERVNNNASMLVYIDTPESFNSLMARSVHVERFTPELAARFFPKTRYDWAKIVKEYPEARWATTDADGRICAFHEKPVFHTSGLFTGAWTSANGCLDHGEWDGKQNTPDWRDSLEARPEWI